MTTRFVISIDFGTAYSCYCYCERANPAVIISQNWVNPFGGAETPKTPTCILFDEAGEFMHFGYEALKAYRNAGPNKKCFFYDFKMLLYNREINRNMMISDSGGNKIKAMKVFSESIRYLKEHALDKISKHIRGNAIASDATWVLTVPTIWDPAAKQFMRKVAIEGGLISDKDSSRLIIALEPEAASVWCKQLSYDGFISEGHGNNTLVRNPGTQYIVVDCGGGTVDMTVHKVTEDMRLKELLKAGGNNMGGGTVDAEFKEFLRDTFGHDLWGRYEKTHPSEVQGMMIDFKILKCDPTMGEFKIRCPYYLDQFVKEEVKRDISSFFTAVQGASWSHGCIEMSLEKLKGFFKNSVDRIVHDIKAILDTPNIEIEYILLVGGYSSCKILQDEVEKQFGVEYKILFPLNAQLAVAKGAVLYGLKPTIVASRVTALTYGIEKWTRFEPGNHKVEKMRENKAGEKYCADLFHRFVHKGQSLLCNEIVEHNFCPINPDQTAMTFEFYSTESPNAKYVDEQKMKNIGQFTVKMPDVSKGKKREVKLEILFGLTEIEAIAYDLTSNERGSVRLEFMTE